MGPTEIEARKFVRQIPWKCDKKTQRKGRSKEFRGANRRKEIVTKKPCLRQKIQVLIN